MVFSSLIFLYAFFSLSLAAYALCRTQKAQNAVLLVFSLVFYAWGEPKYVLLLMFMAFTSWLCALGVERAETKKGKISWVWASAIIDIALIGYYKYAGLICSIFGEVPAFIANIALPIGISFYTFQLLTYVIDVYRKDAPAQKRYWNVLLYAALFHQCIAGPIVRYKTIDHELFSGEPRQPQWHLGVSRFCAGLAKKVLLANPCGALADSVILADSVAREASQFAANAQLLENIPVLGGWLGILAYGLHIYLDFSAYSDMAIGMGKMLGLNYLENFNYPYISRTVTEFWRRWHMSLGTFFRDYVYIPLGGSRCSKMRMVFNTFVVWALTGLWHGASWNFVVWGLIFAVLLLAEKWLPWLKKLGSIYVLPVVMLSFVVFNAADLGAAVHEIGAMFGLAGLPLVTVETLYYLRSFAPLFVMAMVGATPIVRDTCRRIENTAIGAVLEIAMMAGLLIVCTAYLVDGSFSPFLYFRF